MINIKRCSASGYLILEITYLGVRTEQLTHYSDTPENQNLLNFLVEQMQTEITEGTFCFDRYMGNFSGQQVTLNAESCKVIPTFGEFSQVWLSSKSENWTRFVMTKVREVLQRHLIPTLGKLPLNTISESELLQLRISLSHHSAESRVCLSAKHLNFAIKVAHQILRDSSILFDFTAPTLPAHLTDRKTVIDPFSFGEINTLMRHVPVILLELFQTLFFSGMRLNEVCALQWEDVDFDQGIIRVRNTFCSGQLMQLSNIVRRRDIPMSHALRLALSSQYLRTGKSTWVFTPGKDKPICEKTIGVRVWDKAMQQAGVRYRNVRQCHWSAALQLLVEGTSLENVAKQLGITNLQSLIALKRVVDEKPHDLQYQVLNTSTNQQ